MGTRSLPRGATFAILASIFLLSGTVYIYFIYPVVAAGPEQPIPFSHRLHVNVKKLDCTFCHNTVERSRFAGMPPVEKCLYCHDHIIPEHPQIRKLRDFAENGEPVPWEKVTYLPDHVWFSHQRHVKAGVSCVECHGDVENMDRIREVFTDTNDGMTLQGHPLKMGFCLECHQGNESLNGKIVGFEDSATNAELVLQMTGEHQGTRAPVDCWTCHQ